MPSTGMHGCEAMESLMADQHRSALGLLADAMGRPVTLGQALLDCCTAWPDQVEADRWRKIITVEDYMSARDQIAQARRALA